MNSFSRFENDAQSYQIISIIQVLSFYLERSFKKIKTPIGNLIFTTCLYRLDDFLPKTQSNLENKKKEYKFALL